MISFIVAVLLRDCFQAPQQYYLVPLGRVDIFLDVEQKEWVGQLTKPTCFSVVYLAKEVYVLKINYMGKDAYVSEGHYRLGTDPKFGCDRLSADIEPVRKRRSYPAPRSPLYKLGEYPAPDPWKRGLVPSAIDAFEVSTSNGSAHQR